MRRTGTVQLLKIPHFFLTRLVQRSNVNNALPSRSSMVLSKPAHKANIDETRFHM